jgi:hypothetical protein
MLLALCAGPAAAEPQGNAKPTVAARLYFLRPSGFLFLGATPDIKINGQQIGSLGPASYMFVSRPPGRYTITVRNRWLDSPSGFETEIQVASGAAYYFEVGPPPARLNIEVLRSQLSGVTGRAMPGRKGGALSFCALDARAGAAAITNLKAVETQ